MHEYTVHNVFIGWRKLIHAKNLELYEVIDSRTISTYGLIFLGHCMFEYCEGHFQSLLVDLRDMWADLLSVADVPFLFKFSEAELERIKMNSDGAVVGTNLVVAAKEKIGDLWPDKWFMEHERYDDCKAALSDFEAQILEQLHENEEERNQRRRLWAFEC
jgi:hypothetical protein